MLSIRNAEPADFDALKAFMVKEGQWHDSINFELTENMLLAEEETIFGYATATLYENKPLISAIYIPEKLRNHLLGDATLRGLLYYFMNRGFEKVYAHKQSAISEFLRHEGFMEQDDMLAVDLDDFFNQKCRGCRDNH